MSDAMLNIAIRAARKAGDYIVRRTRGGVRVDEKDAHDFVSDVDKGAENLILREISRAYPEHAFLAEESGASGNKRTSYRWIIDPLDGTSNYLNDCPHFCVSIALEHRGQLKQAVVYDPLRDELYCASEGRGAYLNNRRIRVSKKREVRKALIGISLPLRHRQKSLIYKETLQAVYQSVSGVRRFGAAALDLAYVACGRLDGIWEYGLKPWDIAAGLLLIKEAGGLVSDHRGKVDNSEIMRKGDILAGNSILHSHLLSLVHSRLPREPSPSTASRRNVKTSRPRHSKKDRD